jgi:alpha-D-xyloside xylohydrolase
VQRIATLRVYSGADADFDLYKDDGTTYNYEKGNYELTHLHWFNATGKLSRSGAALNVVSEKYLIEVIGDRDHISSSSAQNIDIFSASRM